MSEVTVAQARARQAELIARVRNGTPPLWTPKPGWSDRFTDAQIWEAYMRAAADADLTVSPMTVAVMLVEDVIDGRM